MKKKSVYVWLGEVDPALDGFEVWVGAGMRARRAFELVSRLGLKFNEVVDGDGVSHFYFDYRSDALKAEAALTQMRRQTVKDTFRGMEGNL